MSKLEKSSLRQSVLVVAAHPDDEVLGCGGAIARHIAQKDSVHILILAEGLTSRDSTRNRARRQKDLTQLARAAQRASRVLGATSLTLHGFPDNRMDSVGLEVVKVVESAIARVRPAIVYTHHSGDVNIDHRIAHQSVVTACRPQPRGSVKTLLFFEVTSSTNYQTRGAAPVFTPDWFTNISTTLSLKLKALEAYAAEMRPWPHARSYKAIAAQAHWRGASVGMDAAEAFMLGRHLD